MDSETNLRADHRLSKVGHEANQSRVPFVCDLRKGCAS